MSLYFIINFFPFLFKDLSPCEANVNLKNVTIENLGPRIETLERRIENLGPRIENGSLADLREWKSSVRNNQQKFIN